MLKHFSVIITLIFALYNGAIGIIYQTSWNISISIYYILLFLIRLLIILSKKEKITYIFTSIFLFIINLALIAPITIMALNQKNINIGLIPAIGIATYTTYKITNAIIHYKKNYKNDNLLDKQNIIINLVDSIVSILTLQNTLILVNGEMDNMTGLVIITSFILYGFVLFITIFSFCRNIKYK